MENCENSQINKIKRINHVETNEINNIAQEVMDLYLQSLKMNIENGSYKYY
jgi:hypothetical protein